MRRKEEAKKAVQEALARRQELEKKRVKLEKEAAEAERRVSEQDRKNAEAALDKGQNWNSLKALFNLETNDASQDQSKKPQRPTAEIFGSGRSGGNSADFEVPSIGFGEWFGTRHKKENEATEKNIDDPTTAKESSSMFDFFGGVDKTPPKEFRNARPKEMEKAAKPANSMFSFFGTTDQSSPTEVEKTSPKEPEKAKPTSSMFGLFGSTEKSSSKELETTPPSKELVRAKPENDWWKSIVFDFFGARDDNDEDETIKRMPGRGTVRIADQGYPKKSVFDLFIDTASLWARNEPGRATICIEKNPKPSIFSFFANNKALQQSPLFSFFESKSASKKVPEKDGKKDESNSIFSFLGKTQNESSPSLSSVSNPVFFYLDSCCAPVVLSPNCLRFSLHRIQGREEEARSSDCCKKKDTISQGREYQ